jgi:hypothetical protein
MGWEAITNGWGVTGAGDSASAAIEWQPFVLPATPTYDENTIWDSLVDNGSGDYTMVFDDSSAADGPDIPDAGAIFIMDMPADIVLDGTEYLALRITPAVGGPPSDSHGLWIACGYMDNAGDCSVSGNIVGPCFRNASTNWYGYMCNRTALQAMSTAANPTHITTIVQFAPLHQTVGGMVAASTAHPGGQCNSQIVNTAYAGASSKLFVMMGFAAAGVKGNKTQRATYEYARIPVPS